MTYELMGWISTERRTPVKEDADPQGAVLAWHVVNGTMVVNYSNVKQGSYFIAWMKCPTGPENAREARRRFYSET